MDADVKDVPVTSPEFKRKLRSLTAYLVKHIPLKTLPVAIKLVNSEKNAENPFGKTGYYDHETKKITLFFTGRHDTDILRTFAHEMIHHWQNERGVLHPKSQIPNDHETKPHYAQNDMWLRKREMEAYLFGCILFRDWQDEQRSGPPEKPPFLPQPYD